MNTAQIIIILMAIACGFVVLDAYQQSHQPPPSLTPAPESSKPDPTQARYAAQVQAWRAKMTTQGMTVTWPYLGLNEVVRVDLPSKVPITLADWDAGGETKAASDAYYGFLRVRKQARIANPGACIVHIFLPTPQGDEEVAQASASGVVTSAQENLGTG